MSFFDIIKMLLENKTTYNINLHKNTAAFEFEVPERMEKQPLFLSHSKKCPVQTQNEAYFKNGILYNVMPRNKMVSLYEDRQTAYNARYIVSDGVKYDLENPLDINAIAIPQYKTVGGISNPIFNLDYILKMRLGTETRPALAVPLAYKVAGLMKASEIGWDKKDYYRLPIQLWSIGEIWYGDHLLEVLKANITVVNTLDETMHYKQKNFDQEMKLAQAFKHDYIQIGYSGCVCGNCAPYQNRIYSISGRDRRFPKIPDFIMQNKGLHCNNSINFCTYYTGDTLAKYVYHDDGRVSHKDVDAIKYSNRPFVDDRTKKEKHNYIEWVEKNNKRLITEENYYNRDKWIADYNDHLEYNQIVELLKEKAPKSFSGYKRMKNNNTTNYQKIKGEAETAGIKIN